MADLLDALLDEPGGDGAEEPQEPESTVPEEGKPDDDAREAAEAKSEPEWTIHLAQFFNHAHGGVFGVGAEAPDAGHRATGLLGSAEIEAALAHYVKPGQCFDEAYAALKDEAVVVLSAPAGSGKRSGAIALLAELAPGANYTVLSPDCGLEQLAERVNNEGEGYVLLDRLGADPAGTADFHWRQVRNRLRDQRAYLVVTTVHSPGRSTNTSVRHVDWHQPDAADLLRVRLRKRGCAEPVVDKAVELIPPTCGLADLVVAAERIGAGGTPEEVWDDHAGIAAAFIEDWCAGERTLQQIAEATTLAFAVGSGYRRFESLQASLEILLAKAFSATPAIRESDEAAAGDDSMSSVPDPAQSPVPWLAAPRRLSLKENPLAADQSVRQGPITTSVVVFADRRYRLYLFRELWRRYSTDYWNAVREWLDDSIRRGLELPLQISIASGLALLAEQEFNEVRECYLTPWARGEAGPVGRSMAVFVLWSMCLEGRLDAAALMVAREWAEEGGAYMRATAAGAFGGVLGVRFPTDAVKRLWEMIADGGVAGRKAAQSMADLFAALSESGEDASIVVRVLVIRLAKLRNATIADRVKKATFDTVLGLLSLRDEETGRCVVPSAVERQPTLLPGLCELLAGLLRNRPYRRRTLDALVEILSGLADSADDPAAIAELFGNTLGLALPRDERMHLDVELRLRAGRLDDLTVSDLIRVVSDAVLTPKDPNIE